jgi:hypothetical protein
VARDIAAVARLRDKVVKFQSELGLLQAALQAAERSAADKEALEKKREELRAQKAEETRVMSDAGVMMLVQIRLSYQSRFDNRSDNTDSIWAHIHNDFMKKVTEGDLPHSDGRNVQALEKRFHTELGEFRLWAAKANRAVTYSGVPADKVEEEVKEHYRNTTSLFRRSNFEQRPMSVPPYQIHAESAPHGGDGNVFGGESAGAASHEGDEEDEEDEEDDELPRPGGRGRGGGRGGRGRGSSGGAGGAARASNAASGASSSSSAASGSASCGEAPSAATVPTPKPLHIGGASGASSGKKRSVPQAAPLADFIEMFRFQQEENRKAMKAQQEAQLADAEAQRQHEEKLAQTCKQQ